MKSGTRPTGESLFDRFVSVLGVASRYDLILLAVPFTFLLGTAVSLASPMRVRSALVVGSFLSLLLLSDGVIRNPPRLRPN